MTLIIGTAGRDFLLAGLGGAYDVSLGAGADNIQILRDAFSRPGGLRVHAGDGDDVMRVDIAGGQSAIIHGGAGADYFDLLAGGIIHGDAGADIFAIHASAKGPVSTIADFSAEDRLNILPYLEARPGWVAGTDPFAAGLARVMQIGADTLVQAKTGDSWTDLALIANQSAAALTVAQLGFAPVVASAPIFVSMSPASTTLTEGGKLIVDVRLSAPSAEAVTVTFDAMALGYGFVTTAIIPAGQSHIQLQASFVGDKLPQDLSELFVSMTASGGGARHDPHPSASVTRIRIDNGATDPADLSAASAAYRSLTQLDAVKAADSASLPKLWSTLGSREAVHAMDGFVLATTSVALTAYQFFTGKTPGAAGLKFLVNSPDNASDLNDAGGIYAVMNTENRYINFAANLGLVGEGKAGFSTAYQGLTFRQAVEKAYDVVIGNDRAAAAGIDVNAAIDSVVSARTYFDALATERMGGFDHDLAMKAGMVGYLIAEGQKAHVGNYARAVENFYIDLLDRTAQHNVDLVAVYGPSSLIDLI